MRSYSQIKTIYILNTSLRGSLPQEARYVFKNGVSGSYMDAVFELVARKESSLSHSFIEEGLLQLAG